MCHLKYMYSSNWKQIRNEYFNINIAVVAFEVFRALKIKSAYLTSINKHQRIPKGGSRIDNQEKLTTQGTQDKDKQNKNNQEKLATQGTQDKDKQNKNNQEKLTTQGTQNEDKQNKNNQEKLAT